MLSVDVQCGCPEAGTWENRANPQTKQGDHLTRRPNRPLASGALVESVDAPDHLTPLGCSAMTGKWSAAKQEWTPDKRAPTVDCKCTIDVTVGAGNLEDVNAHFIDKPGAATPQPDDRLAPPPPPDEWDHAADAENEEPGGGAAPMGTECKGNWRCTGSWDGSDSYECALPLWCQSARRLVGMLPSEEAALLSRSRPQSGP